MNAELNPIQRLTRDLKKAAVSLSDDEARFLVDAYYIMQEDRKRTYNQERALNSAGEPHDVVSWLAAQSEALETQIKGALDKYTEAHVMGSWMRQIMGIGPVISAGMLAHIDINQCPTVGHVWAFAGLAADGQKKWEKGQKRPFNAKLKTLCWKAGQSFLKLSGRDDCFYGRIYKERKAYEVTRNERGDNRENALARVSTVGKTTDAFKHYSAGVLPPAQIDARARRYAVKLFLAHLHGVWYEKEHGVPAPLPYPIAHQGHAHVIEPPV